MIIDWLNAKIGKKATQIILVIWYIAMVILILTCIMVPQGRIKYLDW